MSETLIQGKIESGMILAAGLGTRMRPLTLTTPKPLIPVAGRTMADRAVDRLIEAGVAQVVMNVSYLGDQITDHFEKRHDVALAFSQEETPLETGGGVLKALPHLRGAAFFVVNGDAVLLNGPTPALARMTAAWHEGLDVLFLVIPRERARGYDGRGDFTLSAAGLPAFRGDQTTAPYVFTGVQILSRRAFDDKPTGAWSLRTVYQAAIAKGRAQALVHDGDWLHVGTPEGLEDAERYFAQLDPQV